MTPKFTSGKESYVVYNNIVYWISWVWTESLTYNIVRLFPKGDVTKHESVPENQLKKWDGTVC